MRPVLPLFFLWLPLMAVSAEPSAASLRIALAGDSTVATFEKPPAERPTLSGWGQMLTQFLKPEVEVVNLARSGASSKSFRSLGLWDKVLASKPDFVFIQFGHNDQPGKGERTTDPSGDYRDNLRRFITEARTAGATPVLVTSVARRTFTEGKLRSSLGPYVEAMKAVGAETDVPVIDLHQASLDLFALMGEAFSRNYGPSAEDLTHFSSAGARMMARLVAEGISRQVPDLRPHLQLIPPAPEGLPFLVKLETVSQGYDGDTCWVHARAGAIPGATPSVVMTMQKLLLTGSDVFFPLNDLRTDDLGKTWSPARQHDETLGRRQEPGGVICAVCDFTPKWHAASGKLLGIGHTVRYLNDKVIHNRKRETAYAVYDEKSRQWSPWSTLEMPVNAAFHSAGAGSVQRVDLENGDILLPIYFKEKEAPHYRVSVLRCAFDGEKLSLLEQGNESVLESGRGVYEPSLARFQNRFYLTLRNDTAGYVTSSDDGLHFGPIQKWCFDDGEELGNYNTQQHWVSRDDALYLVYTRRGAHNDHVFRHRAPLFMGRVDPETLTVLRDTEVILVPERGARLGNFAVTEVSDQETWVTVTEWMQKASPNHILPPGNPLGADNSVFVARILWDQERK